ncbi:AsmA-like C-terminal region-containing protein [Lishizhenia sp.]|uniref:AsmA-like C-terminal region-containing protein n=1 Tax=Lishizhenia sp. TaxID=2497594 RepID=UPI00299D4208|nr:AsmA-like C-terminal region-containing protein [Lishizhenia sp.]MDX1444834.1 AsmA-like C-terminal region-containing protein [Lishizhenia sp.]
MVKRLFKIFKWVVGIVITLMLLISAALIIFKDDIKRYAIEELNLHLNKQLHVSYIDVTLWKTFPSLSLDFDDVLIHDKFGEEQKLDTTLYAKKLSLRFNPMDFLESNYTVKSIVLKQGILNLKVDDQNRVNYDLLKPTEGESSDNFEFSLEKIKLDDTDFSYENEMTKQYYASHLDQLNLSGEFSATKYTMQAETDMLVKQIKREALTLIRDKRANCKIDISMNTEENIFEIVNADVKIQNLPFHVAGKVSADSILFAINAEKLNLTDVANNFTLAQLNAVKELNGNGDVSFDLQLKGLNKTEANLNIDAGFTIHNGSLANNTFSLSNIDARGKYSSDAKGSELELEKLHFLSSGSAFDAQLKISDFDKPLIRGNAKGAINLAAVHTLFGPFGLQNLEGNIDVNSAFNLRMNNPVYNPKDLSIYALKGNIHLKNITAQFLNDTRVFQNINGEIGVRNEEAIIKNLFLTTGESDFNISGELNNIAGYFKGTETLFIDAYTRCKKINVDDFSSTGGSMTEASRSWLLPTKIKGNVTLNATEIKYGGHTYANITTRMRLTDRSLEFSHLKGRNAGADITGNVLVTEKNPSVLTVATDLASNNIRFAPLFKEWNNFEQTVIAAENIQGIAKIKLKFTAPFDLITGLNKEAIASTLDIEIEDGALYNVETFKEITASIKSTSATLLISPQKINAFEAKLLNLKFNKMSNQVIIRDGKLYIPEMKIESNALDVLVSGEHSFDNDIDYHFDFRFREIKGKNKQTEFGEIVDDGTGFRVYLRMFGNIDDPSYAWDKEAQKKDREEKRQEEINTAKSILKSGFGINKKDTTVLEYTVDEGPKEEITLSFDSDTLAPPAEQEEEKKKSKFQLKLEKLKEQNEKENEVEFQIGQ